MYAVRDDEAALDIVQDAMLKLTEKYADKPAAELPMLFQRILQNTIHDHFRRQKVRSTWTVLLSAFGDKGEKDEDYDPLETLPAKSDSNAAIDPADASYFDHQRSTFQATGLAQYHALISEIEAKYGGTPVGASESIFALMAPALGLNLITPPSFLTAISEGSEPTAADKATIDHQISSHEIEVYVYNSQNATPDIQRQIDEATGANIPITTITETLFPAGATFQAWQVAQLRTLAAALHEATGR